MGQALAEDHQRKTNPLSTEFQKGREWSTMLRNDLNEAKTGIIFLTPENVAAPWIHFEAGALATAVGSRKGEVFTYIYGFDPGKLAGPLSAFQSTVATKQDTRRLVHDLCVAMESKQPTEDLYSKCWAEFEAALDKIPAPAITELVSGFAELFDRKTFREPLADCTNQRWLDRFAVARSVHTALKEAANQVHDRSRAVARQLYGELVAAVDAYAMAMSGFLVGEKHFGFDGRGKLAAPAGAIKACEERRKKCRSWGSGYVLKPMQANAHRDLLTHRCSPVQQPFHSPGFSKRSQAAISHYFGTGAAVIFRSP